jgi:PAS domain S-box-containing protein
LPVEANKPVNKIEKVKLTVCFRLGPFAVSSQPAWSQICTASLEKACSIRFGFILSQEGAIMVEKRTDEQLEMYVRELEGKVSRIAELEDALAKSEDKYNRMLWNLKDEFLFYRHDTAGRFTYISPSYANILGFDPEEYIGQSCGMLWTPNPINEAADRHTKLSCEGYRQPPYEMEIYHKSGAHRRFVNIEIPIFDANGQVIAVEGTARDITEKRKIEEKLENYRKNLENLVQQRTIELQTSQKQLLDIIDFLPDPTYVVDKNGNIIAWNRAMVTMSQVNTAVLGENYTLYTRRLYGSAEPLLIEMVLGEAFPEDSGRMVSLNQHADTPGIKRNGRTLFVERFLQSLNDGRGGYAWITAAPILDGDNKIAGAIESIRDVTQIKQTERNIRESERRLSTLMNNLPGMAYRIVKDDNSWRVEFVSEGCRQIFGLDPSHFTGRNVLELKRLIHPDDVGQVVDKVLSAVAEMKSFSDEYRILSANDETKWVFDKAEAVLRHTDGSVSIEGFLADFTVYKKMEEKLKNENLVLRSTMRDRYRFQGIIGRCQAMQDVFELILKAATTEDNVFVSGESGTGKELVAQAIHKLSDRKDKSFVAVNCAAIPENLIESEFFGMSKGAFTGANADKKGYLEAAEGGTLFLDEIGDISPSLQVKLLRAIDGGGFSPVGSRRIVHPNIRIIAASNKDLEKLVDSGHMRQDFFFRIHVIPIHLPPLRERGDDIFMLINHFLKLYSASESITTFSREDLEMLRNHPWPGNVRELQNVLRRYIALKSLRFMKIPNIQRVEPLPPANAIRRIDADTLKDVSAQFEKKIIQDTLDQAKWNKTQAARLLGVSRKTLFRKMKATGLM